MLLIANLKYCAESYHEAGLHSYAQQFANTATRMQHEQSATCATHKLTLQEQLERWDSMPWYDDEHDALCFCVNCMSRAGTRSRKA